MTFNSSPSLWMRCALSVDASHSVSQNEAPNFFVQMSSLVLLRGLCRFSIALVQNPWSKLPHPRISPSFRTALLPEHPEAHSWISRLISLNLRPPLLLSPHPPPHIFKVWIVLNDFERKFYVSRWHCFTRYYKQGDLCELPWTSHLEYKNRTLLASGRIRWISKLLFEFDEISNPLVLAMLGQLPSGKQDCHTSSSNPCLQWLYQRSPLISHTTVKSSKCLCAFCVLSNQFSQVFVCLNYLVFLWTMR